MIVLFDISIIPLLNFSYSNVNINFKNPLLIGFCVVCGIEILISILGIVAISCEHYNGCFALIIYQDVSIFFLLFNLISLMGVIKIFLLILKINILALFIVYARQIRSQTNSQRHENRASWVMETV